MGWPGAGYRGYRHCCATAGVCQIKLDTCLDGSALDGYTTQWFLRRSRHMAAILKIFSGTGTLGKILLKLKEARPSGAVLFKPP